jgi:hypothetical protein
MSSCFPYQQISITGKCKKNGIVNCILLHEYGLRKRRIEEKPCDYFTKDVPVCDNVKKPIPYHIGVYNIHLEKQAPTFVQF